MDLLKIIIVGDNSWLVKALRLLIEAEPELAIVGTCSIGEVESYSQKLQPHILLFLPEVSVAHHHPILAQLRRQHPRCKMVMITPTEAKLYETNLSKTQGLEFITDDKLHTDLLAKLKLWSKELTRIEDDP